MDKEKKQALKKYNAEKHKEYYKANPEKHKAYQKEWMKGHRFDRKVRVMDMLGGAKCSWCGNNEIRVLEVNHIGGGGSQEFREKSKIIGRRYSGKEIYAEILRKEIDAKRFNVLCRLCNNLEYLMRKYGEDFIKESYKLTGFNLPNNAKL